MAQVKNKLLFFIPLFLISTLLHAEADYVYHEASTNTIGTGTLRFRDMMSPNRTQSMKIGFKIEFQFYWNQARIYYTTDGSNPSGAFGVGSGTTQVLTATFDHNFGSPVVDAVFATIPAQPTGTVVRYIVSAWHSGGGDEIFGNGCGNAPRTFCSSDNRLSSQATVFSYTVQPVRYYVNDNSLTGDVYTTAIGNDGNNGLSPATPKATAQSIINTYTLAGTDTIYIDNGNYTESFTITNSDNGSIVNASPFRANYIVFKGAGNTKTLFTAAAAVKFNLLINRAEYVWVEGISFSNSNATDSSFNIVKEYGNSSVIKSCKLSNTSVTSPAGKPSVNIFLRSTKNTSLSAQRTLITNNIIDNSGQNGIGVFLYGDVDFSRVELNRITMTGSDGRGILFGCLFNAADEVSGTASYWPVVDTVTNNTITANNHGIECNSSSSSNKLYGYLIESNKITINNTAASRSGIFLWNCGLDNTDDFEIKKNILSGGYAGIYIFDLGEFLKIHNNYICSIFGLYSNNYIGFGTDKNNQFLHNSLYTSGSCMYFDNRSQDDWEIQNNILYTSSTNVNSACMSFVSRSGLGDGDLQVSNGNLFYSPLGASTVRINSINLPLLSNWQSSTDICNTGSNDPNSLERIPPYQNPANCDLDLVPDMTNWGSGSCGGYPNWNCVAGFGVDLRSTINTDIKNAPSRPYGTIGAWEVGSSMAPLPVNLITFNARLVGRKVMLDWQTASETNSDYFEVERSKSGTSEWAFVSRVNARGYANSRIDYQSIDHKPYQGVNYYRLKMVDNDGRVSYSPIRKVANEAGVISIYPNPAQGYIMVSGLNKNKMNMLHLLDVSGKLLQEQIVKESQFRFDLTNLAPGVYYLSINGEQHYQFVKSK